MGEISFSVPLLSDRKCLLIRQKGRLFITIQLDSVIVQLDFCLVDLQKPKEGERWSQEPDGIRTLPGWIEGCWPL